LPAHAFMESIVALSNNAFHSSSKTNNQNKEIAPAAEQVQIGGLVALLKVTAGRALEHTVREAQQIMGGLGYSRTGKGARIEQISRDVRVMVVGGGSEEILRELAFAQEGRDLMTTSRQGRSML
jgi:alkylation response protein AidB-like acyl-CoA dehydrogenase